MSLASEALTFRQAAAEAERTVAWLRLPAVALLALGAEVSETGPPEGGFFVVLGIFAAWSAALLAWVSLRPAGQRLALAATAVDVAAITTLAVFSGGGFSHARLAYFLVPIAIAFRFRPSITAAAAVMTVAAYVLQALLHASVSTAEAGPFITAQTGYLVWTGTACVLLSGLLTRRTERVARLAQAGTRLLTDALSAEQRERSALAEALHDHALQNLLAARHELEEVSERHSHPALARAESALAETVSQLRDAVFELHPFVLAEAGLEEALRSTAENVASRAGFQLELDLRYRDRHPHEQLLFSAGRELLANIVRHAGASRVAVRLGSSDNEVALVVEDDGKGFDPEVLSGRLANGHVGLASQRVRVEAAGGSMTLSTAPGRGTIAAVRLPR